jgi:hypothetical protein
MENRVKTLQRKPLTWVNFSSSSTTIPYQVFLSSKGGAEELKLQAPSQREELWRVRRHLHERCEIFQFPSVSRF